MSIAFASFFRFGNNAFIFYIGAIFIRDDGLSMKDLFVAFLAIMMAASSAGNNAQFMGDINKGYTAAKNIF